MSREEQGQQAASDLDDYDDRYDARSGMAGLVSFSDSFAMGQVAPAGQHKERRPPKAHA